MDCADNGNSLCHWCISRYYIEYEKVLTLHVSWLFNLHFNFSRHLQLVCVFVLRQISKAFA